MIGPIAAFEARRRVRMLSTYVYFAIFLALSGLFMLSAGGAIPGAVVDFGTGGKVSINSPWSLAELMTLIGHFGVPITAAIAGRATFQDIDSNSTALFFTAPISKADYLIGRFLGAFGVIVVLSTAIGLGAFLACCLPLMPATRVEPQHLINYLNPYLLALLPNLFFTSALFFCLATLTRRMLPVYVGAVVVLLGYLIALGLAGDVERRTLAGIIDPFGLQAIDDVTHYWSIAEKNSKALSLVGSLLWNRALWTGIGAALLGLTYARFSFSAKNRSGVKGDESIEAAAPAISVPTAPLDFSSGAEVGLLGALYKLQLRETVKSVLFGVIVFAGLLYIGSLAPQIGRLYGTPVYPVTAEVLAVVGFSFGVFMLVVLAIYAGELVWRERDAGMGQIFDALPVPRWVVVASKIGALVSVQAVLLTVVMVAGILIQTLKGYPHFQLGLYLRWLFGLRFPDFACLSVLAILIHVLVNQKYVGHFAVIFYLAIALLLPIMGWEHHLYRFGTAPAAPYSDMNGFGHFVEPLVMFKLYWGAIAIAMAVVADLFWVRGSESSAKARVQEAARRFTPKMRLALGAPLAAALGLGAFIFFNTNVLNPYRNEFARDELPVQYERLYKTKYEHAAIPRILAVKANVDLFPDERRVELSGEDTIVNNTAAPIVQVSVRLPRRVQIRKLEFAGGQATDVADPDHSFYVYSLKSPLAPGQKTTMSYALGYDNPGFANDGSNTRIVGNGTFFDSDAFPQFGYSNKVELADDETRRKHGLAARERARDLDDPEAVKNNYAFDDADQIQFDATVSTSLDQIAVSPGKLEREWVENGRRHFHYVVGRPIFNFYAFLSARYAVRRDRWHDVDIEIDYHPEHTFDLDSMVRGVKASLDYDTQNFSPYQHHVVRIVEFPSYERFAQSFPSTIPFSESIGFIAQVEQGKPDAIDYPFYVTSHEVAHQWWGHQVMGADSQGATMLVETLAQYSALMVMKHTYGERTMRRFLHYELDRYLSGRSMERKKELPLMRVEDQGYIHYSKGSLVMYSLQDLIGEDAVNRALRDLLAQYAFKGAPYPTSRALVNALKKVTPADHQYLISDDFEQITLYENRAVSATYKPRPDGKFDLSIEVVTKKTHADALGAEQPAEMNDWLPVGAVDADGNAIAIERRKFSSDHSTVTMVVDSQPAKAGIDPLDELIDRQPDDNLVAVSVASEK